MKSKKFLAWFLSLTTALSLSAMPVAATEVDDSQAPAAAAETFSPADDEEQIQVQDTEESDPVPVKETGFASGSGTEKDPYIVKGIDQLKLINNDLKASYKLGENIDLSEVDWKPIGSYVGTNGPDDTDIPDQAYAFTGSFDGDGFTILGLHNPESNYPGTPYGLFSCTRGATIENLTLKGVNITGDFECGSLVGYAYDTDINKIKLLRDDENLSSISGDVKPAKAKTPTSAMELGGLVGYARESEISYCNVDASVSAPDNSQCVGILAGYIYDTQVHDCEITGELTAGDKVSGIGGLAGGVKDQATVYNDILTKVSIEAGEEAFLVGGAFGHAGYVNSTDGFFIQKLTIEDLDMDLDEGAQRVGGVVGGGYYNPTLAELGRTESKYAEYTEPGYYNLDPDDITISGTITAPDSTMVGVLAGEISSRIEKDEYSDKVSVNGSKSFMNYGCRTAIIKSFQQELVGECGQLFTGNTISDKWAKTWHDYIAAMVGEEYADEYYEMLSSSITGTLYGEAAIEKYSEGIGPVQFACDFINGLETFEIEIDEDTNDFVISGKLTDGSEFSHIYHTLGYKDADMMGHTANFTVFATDDENAGEFRYFLFLPDTVKETYHLEFRYGSDLNDLTQILTGKYAYWLAAAFPTDGNEALTKSVIGLFCSENLFDAIPSTRTESMQAQFKGLTGTWICDLSEDEMIAEDDDPDIKDIADHALIVLTISDNGTASAVFRDKTGEIADMPFGEFTIYPYWSSSSSGVAMMIVDPDMIAEDDSSDSDDSEETEIGFVDFSLNGNQITLTMIDGRRSTPLIFTNTDPDYGKNNNNNNNNNNNGSGGSGGRSSGGGAANVTPAPEPGPAITDGTDIPEQPTPTSETPSFTDVASDAWYAAAVNYVSSTGLMNGVGNMKFEPELSTNRAMIVMTLYRMAGSPSAVSGSTFKDVADGSWYRDAVSWAAANGIVEGYEDGTFRPDNTITRQELAAIIYRYAAFAGMSTSGTADLSGFSDLNLLQDYAVDAMKWAVSQGIITGTDGGRLDPAGSATRAQLATILYRISSL